MDFKGIIKCDHVVGDPPIKFVLRTCPRCLGKEEYGSISTNSSYDITIVEKEDYLEQAIKKILVSKMNRRGYGFNYELLKDVIDPTTLVTIKREVSRCLTFLQNAQQEDKRRGIRYLPSEEIARVINIQAFQRTDNPRGVYVSLSVFTKQGNFIDVNQTLFQ